MQVAEREPQNRGIGQLSPQGIELVTNSPEDFAKFIRAEHDKWGKVIKEAGIRGE